MGKYEKILKDIKVAQKHRKLARYYNVSSIFGNDWAIFYIIIGGRKTGKSYAVTEFLCQQKRRLKENVKNYWLRISETSTKAMLANKANKLVDPDLKRKYDLELSTKGSEVFNHGEYWMEVMPLSQFAKLKGVGFYDKDFEGQYNIILDEFQLEEGERRTSFDILYNFIGMCENIVRTTKKHIRVILMGNTLEEATTILKAFNFIPEKFGRFYLKSKKCVLDNIEPTEEYLQDREGSIAEILGGNDMSNYTNNLKRDISLIKKSRTKSINSLIMFDKSQKEWYIVCDRNIIKRYNNNTVNSNMIIAMKPYLGQMYSPERKQIVLDMYDAKAFFFDSLITQSYFENSMIKIRKR